MQTEIETRADLHAAGFDSFNDAFWLVSQEFDSHYLNNHVAVVSKVPLLHGRHVYGICRSQCWFYPVRFSDDPPNDDPLVAVRMEGDNTVVFKRRICLEMHSEGDCQPDKVNLENISLRFDMVEQVVAALRSYPATGPDETSSNNNP